MQPVMPTPLSKTMYLVLAALAGATSVSADIITLESYSGPSIFDLAVPQTLTITGTSAGTVTIYGGGILTAEIGLPADQTSVYATCGGAVCGTGTFSQTITVTFQDAISNFFLDVYNGQTHSDTFVVADNVGGTVSDTISGHHPFPFDDPLISLASTGTAVTITTADPSWDYSIDDIGFNQATPGSVPEPGTLTLLAAGLIGIGALRQAPVRSQSCHVSNP